MICENFFSLSHYSIFLIIYHFGKSENLGHQPEAPKTNSASRLRCIALPASPLNPTLGALLQTMMIDDNGNSGSDGCRWLQVQGRDGRLRISGQGLTIIGQLVIYGSRIRVLVNGVATTCAASVTAAAGYLPGAAPICRHDERLAVRRRLPVSCSRHSSQPYSTTATTSATDRQYSLVVLHTTLCIPNASAMPRYRKK